MVSARLLGTRCSCVLDGSSITITGDYHRYELHKRVKVSGTVRVGINDILRVGITKTYSRSKFLIPMCFGVAAIAVKSIPSFDLEFEVIPDIWTATITLWSIPFQDIAWEILGALCILTIPLYWLSYRNDLEINTTHGRYLLSQKGMNPQDVLAFQQMFSRARIENQLR